ncbi:hypothetical protein IWQ61_009879 [Dispira simplex]|nr:hypothetical protein IWQ61_009879 [Dispira simplex]
MDPSPLKPQTPQDQLEQLEKQVNTLTTLVSKLVESNSSPVVQDTTKETHHQETDVNNNNSLVTAPPHPAVCLPNLVSFKGGLHDDLQLWLDSVELHLETLGTPKEKWVPEMATEDQLSYYLNGLHLQTQHHVRTHMCQSLEEVMVKALEYEAVVTRPGAVGMPKPVTKHPSTTPKLQKLTSEEKEALSRQGLCFRCRTGRHLAKDCPKASTNSLEHQDPQGNHLGLGEEA